MAEDITFFGLTSFRNQGKKFGIKIDDRRRHFYIIGKTGMGKSNMMENMAIQDIQNGKGVAYIDPHGEGADKILDFVPQSRINDVIHFNPSDLDFPIAFNVMEKVDFRYRHLVASGLMGVFKKVWPDVWSARMEYILNNSILALLEYPDATLLGVNRMLADPEYRQKVVEKITDPIVKSFWTTEYARYTQRYEIEATAAIQNKVGQFISNPLIRNIIGQTKSTMNMRDIMDKKKILIMNLSKGKVGEDNSRLLGALLITKIQLAAMSRVDMPEDERQDFYLYVDEFQNFATQSFANILSEARKYRLNLILGHQYITQMEEEVRDAVFGNVGTLVVFRIGAEDAEFLEREFSPEFTAEDLVNLGKYNIYLKLMIDGVASHPFSATTLAPFQAGEASSKAKIIKASQERYGVKKETVEDKITRWTEASNKAMSPVQGGQKGREADSQFARSSNTGSVQADGTTLYDAVCSICNKKTKIIFEPTKDRPVYCRSCLKKLKNQETQGKENNRNPVLQNVQKPPERNFKPQEPKTKIEDVSFNSRRNKEIRPDDQHFFERKRREINLADLRKVLEESLEKKDKEEIKEAEEENNKISNNQNLMIMPDKNLMVVNEENKNQQNDNSKQDKVIPEIQNAPSSEEELKKAILDQKMEDEIEKKEKEELGKEESSKVKGVIKPGQTIKF